MPIDFDQPPLLARQGNLFDTGPKDPTISPSYSNDLRDIDAKEGWENTASVTSQDHAATLAEGKQNDREYIFNRIAQLTCYMPEKDRLELVNLLKTAAGFGTNNAATENSTDQTVPMSYDAQAMSGVVLERTSGTETADRGQTQLTQGEVRQILARGPVPQSESQTEQNVQIQMLLRNGTEADRVVPILRSRKHPMFPDNVITRYYAGIGETHGQLSDSPDLLRSRSQSILNDIDATQHLRSRSPSDTRSYQGSDGGSTHRGFQRPQPRRALGDDLPQFRNAIIPHELPAFLAHRLPPRPEHTVAPEPRQTLVLNPPAANETRPSSFNRSSIQRSRWAPGADNLTARLPSHDGTLTEIQNLSLAERISPQFPSAELAPQSDQPRAKFSDAGAAARAQYANPPTSTTANNENNAPVKHSILPPAPSKVTSKTLDPGAAARAQYAMPMPTASSVDLSAAARAQYSGHRRPYSGDIDSLVPSAVGRSLGTRPTS